MAEMGPQFDQLRFVVNELMFASLMSSSPSAGLMPMPMSNEPFRLFDCRRMSHESTEIPRTLKSRWIVVSIFVETLMRRLLPTTCVVNPFWLSCAVILQPLLQPFEFDSQ